MNISIEQVGRRHYFVGNTFSVRSELKAAGCRWDPERKQWWTGKQERAEEVLQEVLEKKPVEGINPEDTCIIGSARYKGRTYRLLFEGDTDRGPVAKLAFLDGSKTFWADLNQVHIKKLYGKPKSIQALERFKEQAQSYGTENCRCFCHRESGAGKPGSILYDGCDRCGCEVL